MELKLTQEYKQAIETIKFAILRSQYQAGKGANKIQLSLYFGIGKYVSVHSRKAHWGDGAIEVISLGLQKDLPGLRGFSARNIKYMRQFYEEWAMLENRQPVAAESEIQLTLLAIRQPMAAEFSFDEFLSIGFSHHIEILTKAKTIEERTYYIHRTFINHWSKYILRDHLKADDFHKIGYLPNNFNLTIPDAKQALKAANMFKDEYLLDFINVEQLGERDIEDVDEKVVELGIVNNIKKFIMMFGRGFTFIGNQYRLVVGDKEFFVDLLFFNREISALVAIELKGGDFKPSYLGQLNFYLQALDDQVRLPNENPTIGLVLCKEADRTVAEYAVRDYTKPMGVATYRTSKDMPKKLRDALPDIEDLKKLLL